MIIPLKGHVDMADFRAIGERLAVTRRSKPIVVLLDWSGIATWVFRPPARAELLGWLAAAEFIDRVAIVHPRTFDRQAAWLGALLRSRGCQVRSYRSDHVAPAKAWLKVDATSSRARQRPGPRVTFAVFE
jgi:hypothetical protein